MFYERVLRALNRGKVRYLVIGGLAVNLHGIPRMTADLDIMVDLESKNLARLARVFRRLGYVPKIPVKLEDFARAENRRRWQIEKGMVVFSVMDPEAALWSVDIMIRNPIRFDAAFRQRVTVNAGGFRVPVLSVRDLIRLKKLSGREQDVSDVVALRSLRYLGVRIGK